LRYIIPPTTISFSTIYSPHMLQMDNADDRWGCVEPSELFSSTGKTPSLKSLVDQLQRHLQRQQHTNSNGVYVGRRKLSSESSSFCSYSSSASSPAAAGSNSRDSSSGGSSGGTMRPSAPKILKRKQGMVERPPSLKRVRFEVEKFVTEHLAPGTERLDADTRLAIRLGARPAKRHAINYKLLLKHQQRGKEAMLTSNTGGDPSATAVIVQPPSSSLITKSKKNKKKTSATTKKSGVLKGSKINKKRMSLKRKKNVSSKN
jgi:hypothetical protein